MKHKGPRTGEQIYTDLVVLQPTDMSSFENNKLSPFTAIAKQLTYPDPIKKKTTKNKLKEPTPSAISSPKWGEYYKKVDEEKKQKEIDKNKKKEVREELRQQNILKRLGKKETEGNKKKRIN